MSTAPTGQLRHVIEGRTIDLPVEVRDASAGSVSFLVDARAAAAWLPDPGLRLLTPLPGRAVLSVTAIDYRDNDLGDYDEISVALFVRPAQTSNVAAIRDLVRGRPETLIRWLPVDQPFTCEAGRRIWGFPKWVDEVDVSVVEDVLVGRWIREGQHVLTVSVPARGHRQLPDSTMKTYTVLDERLHATPFVTAASEARVGIGRGAKLELGDHPFADELRSLGALRRPIMASWMGSLTGRFEAATPV